MTKENILKIIEKCSTLDIDGTIKYVDRLDYDKLASELERQNELLKEFIDDDVDDWAIKNGYEITERVYFKRKNYYDEQEILKKYNKYRQNL